jgi:hypothetical protein
VPSLPELPHATIDPYKASGPDKISHKMLKISPEKIAIPLQIFNKSLRQCKYPFSWKNAHSFHHL